MGQDRRKYNSDRILIEAARILAPQFSGTTITLTGAMVELLRNITAYLHQERTFVDEYHDTYYLTASIADFDELSAIVADLEERLMGNPNIVWGYGERLTDVQSSTTMPAGDSNLVSTVVPAGKVWRVQYACTYVVSATCTRTLVTAQGSDGITPLKVTSPVTTATYYPVTLDILLEAGDSIYGRFYTMTLNDTAYLYMWGYSMDV